MEKVKSEIYEVYTYETRQERDAHVFIMESEGWGCSGKVRQFTGKLMIDDQKDEKNYVWIGEFYKNNME